MKKTTLLPFNLKGEIYRTTMPFGLYDPEGEVFQFFKDKNISLILILTEEKEWLEYTKQDLKNLYLNNNFEVLHFPISDYNVPEIADLKNIVKLIQKKRLELVPHATLSIEAKNKQIG